PQEQVKEVLTNVLYVEGLRALVRLGGDHRFGQRAESVQQALIERCYDERAGLFYDLAGPDDHYLRLNTWSALAPICLDQIPEQLCRRAIDEHLLNRTEYVTAVPIPSVATSEPTFNPGAEERRLLFFHLRRYWRGPSWVNTAWMLIPAMRRLG